jgi:hypothetical protein
MSLVQGKIMKAGVGVMKIPMLVKRVKVDLACDVIKKQKITWLHPTILLMLVMSFPGKILLKK